MERGLGWGVELRRKWRGYLDVAEHVGFDGREGHGAELI